MYEPHGVSDNLKPHDCLFSLFFSEFTISEGACWSSMITLKGQAKIINSVTATQYLSKSSQLVKVTLTIFSLK